MEAMNKTVFDMITEQFINERLDDIMMLRGIFISPAISTSVMSKKQYSSTA